MRFVIAFWLFGFVQSVQAITKCELNGKVTYKRGDCPEKAETRFLVKNKYIKQQDLQESQRKRILASEKALEQALAPKVTLVDSETPVELGSPEEVNRKIKRSNESLHFQLQKVERLNNKTGKVYSPNMPDDLSGKLLDMELQVQEHNKALQQLQKK
ncbi:MAG: hypothetical protein P1P78_09415 [Methyloprofundus sp.]|nr:hypothetical protein [Methyloprofundus sp.]